jgi:NitT/TauT family transport system substrate-binding protein
MTPQPKEFRPMRNHRKLTAVTKPLASLMLAVLTHVLASAPASGQLMPMKIGYSTIAAGQSLVWVTREAGIFKKNGLDVDLVFIGSSTIATQALIARNVPIVVMSGVGALSAVLAGSDLVIVGSTKNEPVLSYLVTNKNITQISQLNGKRLGVSRIGASSDYFLRYLLKRMNINPEKDVQILQVGSSPLRVTALANGGIDGTVLEIEEMIAAKKFGAHVLVDVTNLGIESLNSDIVTTRRYAADSRDAVKRFVKSMVDGLQFYRANKKFSTEVIARYSRSSDFEKIDNAYQHNAKIYLTKPYPTVKGIRLALEQIGERNPAARTAPVEQFIDNSFVKELDDSGYIDKLYP